MIHRLVVPLAYRSLLLSIVVAGVATVFVAPIRLLRGEQLMSATVREISAGVSWTGNAFASSTTFDPKTCQPSRTCDIFTLSVEISDSYRQKHTDFAVAIRLGWDDPQSDFDLYVSKGGEMIAASSQGQTTSEEVYLDQPTNGIYHVYTQAVSAAPRTRYIARVRVVGSAPAPSHRTANYRQDPDGIEGPAMFQFAPQQWPPSAAADHNAPTTLEIDPFGNIHLVSASAASGTSADYSGKSFRVFPGASRGDIYLARCERPCTQPVTRRIFNGPTATLDHMSPVIAADRAGGLHVAFSDGHDLFLISSADHGISWKDPVLVTNPDDPRTATAAPPSIFAGDSGRVGLLWSNSAGDLYYAATLDAFAPQPTIDYVRVVDAHENPTSPSGAVDPFGNAAIAYGTTTFLRQTAGQRLFFASFMTMAGILETETGIKHIAFTVREDFDGFLTLFDEPRKLSMKSARFTSSKRVDGKIALSGRGTLDDGTPVTFTMVITGSQGQDSDFSISMSNGYFAAGVLRNTPLAAKMLNEKRRTE